MTERPRLDAALIAAGGFLVGVLLVVVLQGVNHDQTRTITRSAAGPTTTRTETRTETRTVQATPVDSGVSVPDVTGQRLDEARQALGDAGLDDSIVSGGGALGPIDDSAWVVVDQDPPGGSDAQQGDTIDLSIERP